MKTTLAPGSRVVTDYLDRAGLTPYLEQLGFDLVGYGCTTCIGNSGPLIPAVSAAVTGHDLTVCSVLSGNRNFEGRIHAECQMNFLTSPPLVIAYALAGTMHADLLREPLGHDPRRRSPCICATSGRRTAEIKQVVDDCVEAQMFTAGYADVFAGDENWRGHADAGRRDVQLGPGLDLRAPAAVLRRHAARAATGARHHRRAGAGLPRRLGDHRPHLARRRDQEGLPGRALPDRARRGTAATSTPTAPAAATTR